LENGGDDCGIARGSVLSTAAIGVLLTLENGGEMLRYFDDDDDEGEAMGIGAEVIAGGRLPLRVGMEVV
jgi:hypothetical protein